jgi:hypothetical protein
MNKLNFNQSVGFPLETEILDEMQKAWTVLNALGNIAGNLSIISGCEVTGTNVADGVVFINGEVLEFRGGIQQTKVIIIETPTSLEFEDFNSHDVIFTRYATFGTATTFYNWADFKRGFPTTEIQAALEEKAEVTDLASLVARITELEKKNAVFQAGGGMVLWNKPLNQIPTGWQEVVDWRGRIPAGLDTTQTEFNLMGKTGGSKTHTNTIDEMAQHNHDWKYSFEGDDAGDGSSFNEFSFKPGIIPAGDSTSPIGKTGNGTPYSIMNPYRVVLFIEYIG